MEKIKEKAKELLGQIGIEAELEMNQSAGSETSQLLISTPEARLLIGHNGQNLHSLEYLLKKILQKELGTVPSFFLDVNGYRAHILEELKEEARGVAKKVRLYRKEIYLRPMTSFERRIVHMALAEYPDITTESSGEEPRRVVIVKPYP